MAVRIECGNALGVALGHQAARVVGLARQSGPCWLAWVISARAWFACVAGFSRASPSARSCSSRRMRSRSFSSRSASARWCSPMRSAASAEVLVLLLAHGDEEIREQGDPVPAFGAQVIPVQPHQVGLSGGFCLGCGYGGAYLVLHRLQRLQSGDHWSEDATEGRDMAPNWFRSLMHSIRSRSAG